MEKYKVAKLMISVGIIVLLSSILLADLILQYNSQYNFFSLPASSILSTTISHTSQIIVFTASGVAVYGNGIISLQNKYVYLPSDTTAVITFKNTNTSAETVTENMITIPDVLTNVIFPIFIAALVIILIGILILSFRRLEP